MFHLANSISNPDWLLLLSILMGISRKKNLNAGTLIWTAINVELATQGRQVRKAEIQNHN
jgi:hypothetical protein